MRNHFHLLLSERVSGGLSRFLMKLNVGYAKYFNARYGRQGSLFQGRTKKVLVERQAHFLYVPHYIHLNPLDYLAGFERWRERDKGSIRSVVEALVYLEQYRWSSYLDYCGKRNFPSLLTTSLFDQEDNYTRALQRHLQDAASDSTNFSMLE
jgi:putative transposase